MKLIKDKPSAKALPTFEMNFQPQTIEHLGLRLYSSLPPVIGELVSNSWDADAPLVEVTFPESAIKPGDEVVVTDHGHGMAAQELQDFYLDIGRDRREHLKKDTSPKGRKVTGRKGLGKLAVFGVADELEVRTVRHGEAVCIRLNYPAMKAWPRGKPYRPEIVAPRTGGTNEKNGTEVRIRSLRRKNAIDPSWVRRELARRFRMIGPDFKVSVNGKAIKAADQRLREDTKKSWDVSSLAGEGIVDAGRSWEVEGWMGFLEKSSQLDRGIDIYARKKAVELDSMFQVKTTHAQFARAYLVGEVHANFLDESEDFISTARNSVAWESDAGIALQKWGEAVIKDVLEKWVTQQREEKQKKIVTTGKFDEWLQGRTRTEQRVANRLLKVIVDDDSIEPEAAAPLLEIIKANVEFQAFQELVDEIEDSGVSVTTLLQLFKDWRIVEARQRLQIADGHLEATERLQEFIEEGALEVQQLQPLFEEHTWLIDPMWTEADGQSTYSTMLREKFKESKAVPESDRRLDILGVTAGSELHVVELKRPEKTLSRTDLEQIEEYVDWMRTQTATSPQVQVVAGRLIVGRHSTNAEVVKKAERLAKEGIRIFTFRDLLQQAKTVYGLTEKKLKAIAPEYSREARRGRKRPTKVGRIELKKKNAAAEPKKATITIRLKKR
jgi:hypothetical protein